MALQWFPGDGAILGDPGFILDLRYLVKGCLGLL